MKRYLSLVLLVVLIALLFGCVTPSKKQDDLSGYYSMIYTIGREAFQPIAESYLGEGDRVLIVHIGEGSSGIGMRYAVKPEPTEDPDIDPYGYRRYLEDHPFFIEYLENGFINSFLQNGGVGFDRLNLAKRMGDYVEWLRSEDIVFNTSRLDYDYWDDLKEEFDVSKVLVYSVRKVVGKGSEYVGLQLGLTFIDVDNKGKVLYDSIDNVVSTGFPDSKRIHLSKLMLEIPEDSILSFNDHLNQVLSDEGLTAAAAPADGEEGDTGGAAGGIDAVLVKADDIAFLGSYPITEDDFIIEKTLVQRLGSLEQLSLLEKLYKRQYKAPFQLINAVNYINPFRGGEYSEFQNYYGTRYMMTYKVLWDQQTGEIEGVTTENIPLNDKVLGVYVKLIDMTEQGRILLTHFIPTGQSSVIDQNFLYRCFTRLNDLPQTQSAIEETFAMSEEDHATIINKRMEIYKNYLINEFPAYRGIVDTLNTTKSEDVLKNYDLVYKLFDEEEREKVKGDIYYVIAGHLMNGWFEEGITDYLVRNGYMIHDKLESLYSRTLLSHTWEDRYQDSYVEPAVFLSSLNLSEWGADIKQFYNIDKIIYFVALEQAVPDETYITPENVTSEGTAIELSQFYPILSPQINRLLFSILDVNSGDYSLNRNFELE